MVRETETRTGEPPANGVHTAVAEPPAAPEAVAVPAAHGGEGGRRGHRDLTTGSIPKTLFHQAWPQALEGVFTVADQFTDLVWAGRLEAGFRAVASVGVVQTWTQLGLTAVSGLQQATRAFVSRAVGARDIDLANHVVLQALTINFVYSFLLVSVGALSTPYLLKVVGVSADIRGEATTYMRIQYANMAVASLRLMTGAALQASGDPITAFRGLAAQRITHMALSPTLMFGWLWFPEVGLAGASIASVTGQTVAVSLNLYMLCRGNTRLRLRFKGYRVDPALIGRMARLGAPSSVVGIERSVSQLLLLKFVTPFGDSAVAAYAITRRMETFASLGSNGVGQGTGTMVGQNLGALKPDRARQSIYWGLTYSLTAGVVMCALFFVFPSDFVRLFTSNAAVVELGGDWLKIQAFAFLFLGTSAIFAQSFNTAGDTVPAMIVTLLSVWAIEDPLSWVLTQHTDLGPIGIGYAAVASFSLRIALYFPYFLSDRWMRKKVI